jgi:nucleoside-diphosphate-sugar epimerase
VPNAPATTTRAIVGRIASLAGVAPKVSALPSFLVGALGLFDAQIRELKEMLYEFEDDFVIDDTRARNTLGLAPTPLDQSLAATLTWWKERASR